LSNDDWKSTVFSSRRNVVSDGAFLTDDGRLFHAGVEATGRQGHRVLNVEAGKAGEEKIVKGRGYDPLDKSPVCFHR